MPAPEPLKPRHNIIFVPPEKIGGGVLRIDDENYHYVRRVLRKNTGDVLAATDGAGNYFETRIVEDRGARFTARIVLQTHVPRPRPRLDLAFAPLKGSRNDIIVEKGTELGVILFLPFLARYSVVNSFGRRKDARSVSIATTAMLQSRRCYRPAFDAKNNVASLIREFSGYDAVILASAEGHAAVPPVKDRALLVVGPEGGFADAETASFLAAGVYPLSLGSHRLRSETAAVCGIVKILAACNVI